MKKHINSLKKSEPDAKRVKWAETVQRNSREVMTDLVAKLERQFDGEALPAVDGKKGGRDEVRPNRNRLTVGVDLGVQWSNYCILGLSGETLAEGQFRTTREETSEFFRDMSTSRVVVEVGTHSAWCGKSSPVSDMKCW